MNWKNKKVFITGHDGFIGQHLTSALKSSGADIRVCEVDLLKEKLAVGDDFQPEYIFHLAAIVPAASDVIRDSDVIENNIKITENVLEFACKIKAKVILASSSHVYPPAKIGDHPWKEDETIPDKTISVYGLSKQKVEGLIFEYSKKYGLEFLIVRLANVYGPGDKSSRFIPTFIRKCINKEFPLEVLGEKDAVRDFLYIEDAIKGLTNSANLLGYIKVVNIGSGSGTTIEEVAEIIKFRTNLAEKEILYRLSGGSKILYNVLDISLAKKKNKYSPSVGLEDGLVETINWCLKNK
ncbi:MAG: hypothetical protein A2469_00225 [Candidatus Magasanikbacteria bacterium RIFOXYC2_FULL_40_16]|uniref:NAD-dependent epimerase/dehydratase domain-containing protein n=3 Tax=Candidatus Magasanikiibacteriota TaxID=1752731 RepID=A0A1F6NIY8_9BACT|nr:MAG: hypothetical protein A2224_03460 [Candidatus Magasanikbacteria bacterium RIFOXYA2_FULL_40_20]OGH83829.1 MAG: hypothetical protein A2373_00290 [Candidatus Magasanikbacteria bacterium RIFOXYB1_FULL_40_15]OGH86514.1 MAG: hypothetical protein A2301_01420 [Candidatus Magasanikbacteria bacterium RIFOXYB2_FULL_40_13]OGH87729.1 MAG: hypothetical protein A2206_01540 [Candidatus Magasanikbacteria bacterium RIFOXYA1_FULL_40_8]OGH90277.1 MAG: hypothetical protein A2469_00225 [Candidatus Magasanikba